MSETKLIEIEDDPELKAIPAEIREEYSALLDYYTVEELEEIRAEHGDRAIPMLLESEFGDDYLEMYGGYSEEDLK